MRSQSGPAARFLEFYRANPPTPGSVDHLYGGAGSRASEAAGAALILRSAENDGRPFFSKVLLLLLPGSEDHRLAKALAEAPGMPSIDRLLHASALRTLERVSALPPNAALVLACADLLRYPAGGAEGYKPTGDTGPFGERFRVGALEDEWVPHFEKFATDLKAIAAAKSLYVLLHVSQPQPASPELRNRLARLADAILVIAMPGATGGVDTEQFRAWSDRIRAGQVEEVLREIDLASPDATNAALAKIQLLLVCGQVGLAEAIATKAADNLTGLNDASVDAILARLCLYSGRASEAADHVRRALSRSYLDELTLRTLHGLTIPMGDNTIGLQIEEKLNERFPDSEYAVRRRAYRLIEAADYESAISTIDQVDEGQRSPHLQYLRFVSASLDRNPTDLASLVRQVAGVLPAFKAHAVADCVAHAVHHDAHINAADLLVEHQADSNVLLLCGETVGDLFGAVMQKARMSPGDERADYVAAAVRCLDFATAHLAIEPTSPLRLRLANTLMADGSGDLGVIVLVEAFRRRVTTFAHGDSRSWDEAAGEDEILSFLAKYMAVRAGRSRAIGLKGQPLDDNVAPPDRLRPLLTAVIVHLQAMVQDLAQDDIESVMLMLLVGLDLTETLRDETAAGATLGLVAAGLANSGFQQRARDLAEHTLMLAHEGSPTQRYLAWATFSDVYERVHNPVEALLGWLCAGQIDLPTLPVDLAFMRATLLMRLLRSVGFLDDALRVSEAARAAFAGAGAPASRVTRLEHLRGSVLLRMAHDRALSDSRRAELLDNVVGLLSGVLAGDLERGSPPVVTLADEALRLALQLGRPADSTTSAIEDAVLRAAGAANLVSGTSRASWSPLDLQAHLATIEGAYSSEDLARDVVRLSIAGRRTLEDLLRRSHPPGEILLTFECCFGHSVAASDQEEQLPDRTADRVLRWRIQRSLSDGSAPAAPIEQRRPPRIPILSRIDQLAALADQIRERGAALECLALSDRGVLVRASFASDGAIEVSTPPLGFLAPAALRKWDREYLSKVAEIRGSSAVADFLRIAEGLFLPNIGAGSPAIFAMDPRILQVPHNIVIADPTDLLPIRPSCAVPNLSWLGASLARPAPAGDRSLIWVLPHDADTPSTLGSVREALAELASQHGMEVILDDELPDAVGRIDLAIVAGHGGLGPGSRFLVSVAGEDGTRFFTWGLAENVRGARVVVLLVCSGGRFDTEHFSDRLVGLPVELLRRGVRSVVASPWPLDERAARHWTTQFLAAWREGESVCHCVFRANRTLASEHEPADYLAMHVFGDPFQRAGPP